MSINKSNKKIIYIFIGTTAEFIKLIPVIKQFNKLQIKYRIVASGQTDIKFSEFENIVGKQKPYYTFEHKNSRSSFLMFGLWSLRTLIDSFLWVRQEKKKVKNITFLIHGDTVSALIGAIIAKTNGIKLAHVESGLRSFNFLQPFPEEGCRFLISFFTDLHFCQNEWAISNLKYRRGRKVNIFNNTGIETLSLALRKKPKALQLKKILSKNYFIFIVHRQEHVIFRKDITKNLIEKVLKSASKSQHCIFITHDVTKNYLESTGMWKEIESNKHVSIIPRLPYQEFVHVLKNAKFMITDGGGNHVEAYYLGLPCLILRKTTEQTEGIGENIILSKENIKIITSFIKKYKTYKRKPQNIKLWPSKIVVEEILSL